MSLLKSLSQLFSRETLSGQSQLKIEDLRLDENFLWPTARNRDDIMTDLINAKIMLSDQITVTDPFGRGQPISLSINLRPDALRIKFETLEGPELDYKPSDIPLKKFNHADIAELDQTILYTATELKNRGIHMQSPDDALIGLIYIVNAWNCEAQVAHKTATFIEPTLKIN